MSAARRHISAIVSVALVIVVGALALSVVARTNETVERIHTSDRVVLQRTLSTLTTTYLQFALGESLELASTPGWSLRPGDPGDVARLEAFVQSSKLVDHGAVVVGLDQRPRSVFARAPGLPEATDPGYGPLRAALLAGKPGVSNVMVVGNVPVVALGVPIVEGGIPRALLVTYFRADTSRMQGYSHDLVFGSTGKSFVVDRAGVVVAGPSPALVGKPFGGKVARQVVLDGDRPFEEYSEDGVAYVASASPLELGGWTTVIEQRADEFFGEMRAGGTRVIRSLLMVVCVAAAVLAWLAHKRQRALGRVAHQAYHDTLTGLANRFAFRVRLDEALARARRRSRGLAVLFVDLDHFKAVNDSLGHDAGDELLVAVGERLRSCVREVDMLARMGGDEFTIVLEDLQAQHDAAEVALRIREVLAEPVVVGDQSLAVTASIGVSFSDGGDSADDVLRDADLAMYQAKEAGRNRHAMFHDRSGDGGPQGAVAPAAHRDVPLVT